jgi:hypothetical protein
MLVQVVERLRFALLGVGRSELLVGKLRVAGCLEAVGVKGLLSDVERGVDGIVQRAIQVVAERGAGL